MAVKKSWRTLKTSKVDILSDQEKGGPQYAAAYTIFEAKQ